MKSKISFLVLLIVFVVFACSEGASTLTEGGATSETTNGIVAIKVYDPEDQEKLVVANVKVFKENAHPDSVSGLVYEGETDSLGEIEFNTPLDGQYYLDIKTSAKGRRLAQTFSQKENYNIDSVSLGLFSTIVGKVEDIDGKVPRVYLPGSDQIVDLDDNGKYELSGVSPGTWVVEFEEVAQTILVYSEEDDNIDLGETEEYIDGYDRQLIEEVLDKTADSIVEVDDVVTFEFIGSKEVAVKVDLSNLGINPKDMDGTGIPRMSNMDPLWVDLSDNGMYDVSNQWGWTWDRVEYLDLSNNKLSKIPRTFKDMRNLNYLDLRNNALTKLDKHMFILEIDTLLVEGNHITDPTSALSEWLDKNAEPNWRELQTEAP